MENLRLEPITLGNIDDLLKSAKPRPDGRPDGSLHAYIALTDGKPVFPFSIMHGETRIGFLMIQYDIYADRKEVGHRFDWFIRNSYLIQPFWIDEAYHGQGYGKAAMALALDFIRTFPCGKSEYCWLTYEPENKAERSFFQSCGFRDVPEARFPGTKYAGRL